MPIEPRSNPPHLTYIAQAHELRSRAAHDLVGHIFRPVRRLVWEMSGWLSALIGDVVGDIIEESRRRRNIRRLEALDDRILKDIGIRREDIREALSAPSPSNDDVKAPHDARPNRRLISSAT